MTGLKEKVCKDKLPKITIADIEMHADDFDAVKAAEIYNKYGALVVRGMMNEYVDAIEDDIKFYADESISQLEHAVKNEVGWQTPNGTLFIPAPDNFERQYQIMTLAINYRNSAAFVQSAMDKNSLDFIENVLGQDIELFMEGQSLFKEANGGHPKLLHQDSSYFDHKYAGPLAQLNYLTKTDESNGVLHVVPGSHKLGLLEHVDTFSHLGLDPDEWGFEDAVPVCGNRGDSIFFHVHTIHGSKQNFSNNPRPVFINRYRTPDDYTILSGATVKAQKESLKNLTEEKSKNQFNYMVRGRRRR